MPRPDTATRWLKSTRRALSPRRSRGLLEGCGLVHAARTARTRLRTSTGSRDPRPMYAGNRAPDTYRPGRVRDADEDGHLRRPGVVRGKDPHHRSEAAR